MGETVNRQMDKHMKAITSWDKCWEENQRNVEIKKLENIDFRLRRSLKPLAREWDWRIKEEEAGLWKFLGRTVQAQGTARIESPVQYPLILFMRVRTTGGKREEWWAGWGSQPRQFCSGQSCADGLYSKWSKLTGFACLLVFKSLGMEWYFV